MTATRAVLLKRLEAEALQIRRMEHPTRMWLVGMPDDFAVVGPTVPLRAKYGMSAEAIAAACRSLLGAA
jgi:transketolase C-terminal domain/subunit